MSLDVDLFNEAGENLYSDNITHNLTAMADMAGIYALLWRPDEFGITHAHQIIAPLERGLIWLVCNKAKAEEFNAKNGWGKWENLVRFCADYLQACKDHPEAQVSVSR